MFYMIFKNALGEIEFSGDGNAPISITSVLGLGLVDKICQTQEYLDFDGRQTLSSRFEPRTISLSFDLKGGNTAHLAAKLFRVLSREGTLYIISDAAKRRAKVSQISLSEVEKIGSFRSYSAQLICDNPYFGDAQTNRATCFEATGNLRFDSESGKWNLSEPTVWGQIKNDVIIKNDGDAAAYPTITLTSFGDAEDEAGFELLRVKPSDKGEVLQRFALCYALSDGERITLCFDPRSDKKRRYLKSTTGKNLLEVRAEDSSLSDFYLDCGENRIIINNLSRGNTLAAEISYENQYVEGGF